MKWMLSFVWMFTTVSCFGQNRYDVVIDEIMADPTPIVGLPNNEWIELKNVSATPINLQNWRIGDQSGSSGPLPNFTLLPDSFVIICNAASMAAMSVFGTAIIVTAFPSLDNDGDQLFLRSASGKTIHAVNYTSVWYNNEVKKEGGWTLEMIDTRNPCSGYENWKASNSIYGGTPGKKNSIDGVNIDQMAPRLKSAYTTDSTTIILVFDEPVDSIKGAAINNYSINNGLSVINVIPLSPLFNKVQLKTSTALAANTIYTITATNIADCSNNIIGTYNKVRTGLPADPLPGDWVINEILFNPRPGAFDYIEFYNTGDKIIDAAGLYIANRNTSGVISSIKSLSALPYYVFSGEYIVITEDAGNLAMNYPVLYLDNVLTVSSMPSFPDDEGDVITMNAQGVVIDEVKYKDDWHFKLINDPEGVSLERIDPHLLSQQAMNWHSAASTAGYGTPGYKNSQYKLLQTIDAVIEVIPKVFSPDNDGRDDITTIQYRVTESGYVANITIYDIAGRPVRDLVRNAILGLNGYWNWDGLNNYGMKLPVGAYIIVTEIFNLRGKKELFKNIVVLGRLLN